jgi:hypothetical protein
MHEIGRPSQRKKLPVRMERGAVQIERHGDEAILTPRDPDIAVTHLQIGPQIVGMSDEDILDLFNSTIAAREALAAERPYVATEVPPGRPQVRYYPEADQWVPRAGVLRCIVDTDDDDQTAIEIDGRQLSMEEFGALIATYVGWGMRIEFTPDDDIDRRPQLEVRDPEER